MSKRNELFVITVDRVTLNRAIAGLEIHADNIEADDGESLLADDYRQAARELADAMLTARQTGNVLPFVVDDNLVPLPPS